MTHLYRLFVCYKPVKCREKKHYSQICDETLNADDYAIYNKQA